jgi:hypothetical protein
MSDYLKVAYGRALGAGDPSLLQLTFDAALLERYRGGAFSVIRTDTAGRVRREGGWSIDFGIAPGDERIHASWRDVSSRLPEGERTHWAAHAAGAAELSTNFLRMQLAPGSCFDDGEVRPW